MRDKHGLVICSHSRPKDVVQLLKQIEGLPSAKNLRVYIVENSGKAENLSIIKSYRVDPRSNLRVDILQTMPGLVTARNAALAVCGTEYIHFLDDDVELMSDYFSDVEAIFQAFPDVLGIGPQVKILNENRRSLLKLTIQKVLKLEGKVTATGKAYWITNGNGMLSVEWLPGCAMSFRRESLGQMQFSTSLQKGPLGGYALGEDLDFSFRVSKLGTLLGVREIVVIHKLLPNQRNEWSLLDEGLGRFLAYFERNFPEDSKPIFTKIFLLLDTAYLSMLSILEFIFRGKKLRNPLVRFGAYLNELKSPKLEE